MTHESAKIKVKDVGHPGGWDWASIQMELPSNIKRVIQATPIPLAAISEDKLAWKLFPNGDFDLKTAYLLALEPEMEAPFRGKWIWKLKTLARIQSFVWQCMHQSIGVKDCLSA